MVNYTVVLLKGAFPTAVAATLDMLRTAQKLATQHQSPYPTWQVASLAGGTLDLGSGMTIHTKRLPLLTPGDRSVWVIPGIGLSTPHEVERRLTHEDAIALANGIAAHVGLGGSVAASCSAVFLLHSAGLLAGRRVTTTWWLAPLLAKLSPQSQVDNNSIVCSDGKVTTAGAALAHIELVLQLLRDQCGPALVETMRRVLMLDGRQAHAESNVPDVFSNGDELIARLVTRIESCLPDSPRIAQLASEFCVSERTLARHVQSATGKTTIALVQSVRLRRARALLEQSRFSVAQVAAAVGYSDSAALRRLIRKATGANPSAHRKARVPS